MPKTRITPAVGVVEPETARSSVDLPAPFVPSRATISPCVDLEVDVEEHLVGAVEEVEVVDLEGRDAPRRPGGACPRRSARGRPR